MHQAGQEFRIEKDTAHSSVLARLQGTATQELSGGRLNYVSGGAKAAGERAHLVPGWLGVRLLILTHLVPVS